MALTMFILAWVATIAFGITVVLCIKDRNWLTVIYSGACAVWSWLTYIAVAHAVLCTI